MKIRTNALGAILVATCSIAAFRLSTATASIADGEMKVRAYMPVTLKNYPSPSSTYTPSPTHTPIPTSTPTPRPAVVVVSSNAFVPYADSKSLYLVGEVRNDTRVNVEFVKVNAVLRNASGQIVDGEDSYSDLDKLSPGLSSGFRIIFSDTPPWSTYELTVEWDTAENGPFELAIIQPESYFDSSDAFHVRGTVKNQDSKQHTFVQLFVIMYNEQSQVIGVESTYANPSTLEPGQEAAFDVEAGASIR